MFYLIMGIHLLLCAALIGLVLIQQGKGADLGPALGGGSNTLFGAAGATAFVVKATTVSAVLFMATSIYLVKYYRSAVASQGTVADRLQGSLLQEEAKRAQEAPEESAVASTSTPAEGTATPDQAAQSTTPLPVTTPSEAPVPATTPGSQEAPQS